MHKTLVRPHIDYGDMIYDEAYNKRFYQKLDSIQYNFCLALSAAIRGSSSEKLYHELGDWIPPNLYFFADFHCTEIELLLLIHNLLNNVG